MIQLRIPNVHYLLSFVADILVPALINMIGGKKCKGDLNFDLKGVGKKQNQKSLIFSSINHVVKYFLMKIDMDSTN